MTSLSKNILILGFIALFIVLAVWWAGNSENTVPAESQVSAAAASLLTSDTYAIVSDTWTNSLNTGLETAITGDVCYTTPPDTEPISINGVTVSPLTEATVPCPPQVGLDQASALADLNAEVCTSIGTDVALDTIIIGTNPAGTFPPGCYESSGAMDITLSTTVTLDLTASDGDGGNVWIFRSGGALTTGANSLVVLANGALASNVFWTPGGIASLGANSSTSATPTFVGTIIADELGSTGINVGHFAHVSGRLLAFGHTVTTDSNTISIPPAPATLTLTKQVINTGGGTSTVASFQLLIFDPVANSFSEVDSGDERTLNPGSYTVSENEDPLYDASTWSGDCNADGTITLAPGQDANCTITNTYIIPPPATTGTLHVIKLVVNGSGGTATASDFNLHVISATSSLDVAGSPQLGTSTPGTLYTLSPGTYEVSEDENTSYAQSFGGDCVPSGTVTVIAGEDKICTIINTDIPPPAPVSGGGGGGGGGQWVAPVVPFIGILKVPAPLAIPGDSGSITYHYTVWNVGGQQALVDVTVVDDKCAPVLLQSGDLNSDTRLDPNESWRYTCKTTLATTTTNTAVATGFSSDTYRQPAIATAISTVVVGAPIAPPLITIVKIPSRLTPFPFGGGGVTYTYTVTNPGVVALRNVSVTDDTCAPVSRLSGDTDGDNLLDASESWTYACTTNVPVSTRNTATAAGTANGIIALGYAFATVLVSAPGLPDTGFPENTPWNTVILLGILLIVSITLAVVVQHDRKQHEV